MHAAPPGMAGARFSLELAAHTVSPTSFDHFEYIIAEDLFICVCFRTKATLAQEVRVVVEVKQVGVLPRPEFSMMKCSECFFLVIIRAPGTRCDMRYCRCIDSCHG